MQGERNNAAREGNLELRVISVQYFDITPRLSFNDKPLS